MCDIWLVCYVVQHNLTLTVDDFNWLSKDEICILIYLVRLLLDFIYGIKSACKHISSIHIYLDMYDV